MHLKKIPVLRKLVPSVRKRVARLVWPDGHGVVRREGALFLLDLRQWYDKIILKWGPGEPEQRAYMLDNIRRRACDVFIDIGANFGTYAAYVGLQTSCPAIIAYEPDWRSYERLRTHLRLNGLIDRVETHMAAISNRNGTVPFIPSEDGNGSLSKVGPEGSTAHHVPSVRLDDALPLKNRRIAIKMDVEGHEMFALEGMKTLLRENECFLQVECWEHNAPSFVTAMQAEDYRLIKRIDEDHYFEKA